MINILNQIPTSTQSLSDYEASNLVELGRRLDERLGHAPHPEQLDTTYNLNCGMNTFPFYKLYQPLDEIFYSIGTKPYEAYYYFYVSRYNDLQQTILNASHGYIGEKSFGTRVLTNPQYRTTNKPEHDMNWTELNAVSLQLQENPRHHVTAYKNDNTLLVLTNKFTWTMFFKLKALECVFFKDRSYSYNTDVQEVYTALALNDLDKFHKYLDKILNYKTWFKWKKEGLKGCFTTTKEYQLKHKQISIEDTSSLVTRYELEYRRTLDKLTRLIEEYEALVQTEETLDIEEILDYIGRHRYIKDVQKANQSTLRFYIEAPIIYYDSDYIESYRAWPNYDDGAMKYVLTETFINNKYRLWTHTSIDFDTGSFYTDPNRIGMDGGLYLAHPHIDRYGCQGNHPDEIRNWVQNRDYIGAIEQIMTMIYNLNWTDSIVISRMFQTIKENANKPIFEVVETGEFVSFNDILATKEDL